MKKELNNFNLASVLSVSLLLYLSGSLLAPALGVMKGAFPEAEMSTIRLVLTYMYITVSIFSLVSGFLAKKTSKKNVVIIGLLLYGGAGMAGGLFININMIILSRVIMGMGVGLILPQATSMIVELYEAEKREKLLGWSQGLANIGSMIGSIIGGSLALINWKYNFFGFGVAFIILVLVIIGVPNIPPDKTETNKANLPKMPKALFSICIFMFLAQAASLVTVTNMAIFVNSEPWGNPSLLGITMALLTFAGFVAGFVLVYVKKIFKKFTPLFSCITMGAGFVILSFANSMGLAMLSNTLIGFGYGLMIPSLFISISQNIPPVLRQKAISIASAAMYFGCFATAYIQQWIGILSGNPSQRFMFLAFGIGTFVAAAGCIIQIFLKKSNQVNA
ncbi:MFS transporter [Eubacterium limosum]|uniref:MFS transporter n=1 Tax=Eubacterium limosum TaxID=1736 RepID=A0ABT5UNZ5_EUBLI|nr:MFS transporter [Eubacterium limosum]MCB6571325.1 MFS transporter [Eubacterium limosum]MDE1470591.1 MFS transporter [Eubacterium limosum]